VALLRRKVALLPGPSQREELGRLRGPIEIWQRRPAHRMLPASAYLRAEDPAWYKIFSRSVPIVHKLDGIFLELEVLPILDDTGCSVIAALDGGEVALTLMADWIRPLDAEVSDAYWDRVVANPSSDDVLATASLEGYLAWAGLLFGPLEQPLGLLHLDETPESIRFTLVPEEIAAFTARTHVVRVRDLEKWCLRLSGWDVRLGR